MTKQQLIGLALGMIPWFAVKADLLGEPVQLSFTNQDLSFTISDNATVQDPGVEFPGFVNPFNASQTVFSADITANRIDITWETDSDTLTPRNPLDGNTRFKALDLSPGNGPKVIAVQVIDNATSWKNYLDQPGFVGPIVTDNGTSITANDTDNLTFKAGDTLALGIAFEAGETTDFDGDSVPDELDVAPFKSADLNGDNSTAFNDLNTLLTTYGLSEGQSGFNPDADFNEDGLVDYVDYQLWGQQVLAVP